MELRLDRKDLKKTEIDRPLNEIEFEHFNKEAQVAIKTIGIARFYSGCGFRKVYAPKADFTYLEKSYKIDMTQRKISTNTIELPDGTELVAFWNQGNPMTIDHVSLGQKKLETWRRPTSLKATEIT